MSHFLYTNSTKITMLNFIFLIKIYITNIVISIIFHFLFLFITTFALAKAVFNTKKYSMVINIKNHNFLKIPYSLNIASLINIERVNINTNKIIVRN